MRAIVAGGHWDAVTPGCAAWQSPAPATWTLGAGMSHPPQVAWGLGFSPRGTFMRQGVTEGATGQAAREDGGRSAS